MTGIIGPDGSGKTTMIRRLAGFLPPRDGVERVKGRMGYLPQKFALYSELTVRRNLVFFGSAYGLFGRRLKERIRWAEEEFQLGKYMGTMAGEVPLGIKQRLAMAAALLYEPEIFRFMARSIPKLTEINQWFNTQIAVS